MKILVIEAIGLHLGYLGCYGNDWVATPNLDRLAAEGVVFDAHFADQPELTNLRPWHDRSVGTGCYARPGTTRQVSLPIKPLVATIDRLDDFADRALPFFSESASWIWLHGPSLLPPWTLEDELLEAYFDEEDAEEELTVWRDPAMQLADLSEADLVRLQNTYAAVVTFFDAQLGKIFERLPDGKDWLVCVTASAGLPLGEHGLIGAPRPSLHDELVHIPLVMRFPRAMDAGLRVFALTQEVDLLPTFLEIWGREISMVHGKSLMPLIRGDAITIRPYAVSTLRVSSEECQLMRTLDRALHVPLEAAAPRKLFVKPDDRWEVNDLYQHEMETADAMERALKQFSDAIGNTGPLPYPSIFSDTNEPPA
jgi:arylsulfatase A-like enzyme